MQEVWVRVGCRGSGWAGGWPAVALREERGEEGKGACGAREGGEGATGLVRDVGWTNRRRAKQTGSLAQMAAEGWWCVRVPVAKHFRPLFPPGPT